jgi:hypothetical protein
VSHDGYPEHKKGDNVGQNITPKLELRKYFYN